MTEVSAISVETPAPNRPPRFRRLRKAFTALWKFLVAVVCVQSAFLSLVFAGWTFRFMQRTALKKWWKLSASTERFADFTAREAPEHTHFPNWIVGQNFRLREWRRLFASLWLNARLGVAGIFNTLVLTLPGCVLMFFGWYDGWNNSYAKGYEQFWVGPGISWLGILLFSAAMLYVPMAQARQAITGEWRSFYQWRLVWRLVRLRWLWCLMISVLYLLLAAPVMILRAAMPHFWKAEKLSTEELAALSHAEIIGNLNQFFFWCALFIVPAYLFLRWLAARNYAVGVRTAIRQGLVGVYSLSDYERLVLGRLQLLDVSLPPQRHVLLRITARLWRFGLRGAAIVLMLFVWVLFLFELYISQFFHYIPGVGWLNHCLVQLPWFHYIPGHLAK